MEEDFDMTFENSKKENDQYVEENIPVQQALNYMGPFISNFLNDRMI